MEICIPSLPTGMEESISNSNLISSKRLRVLGGTTAATKGDPDVRGGNFPSSPKPDQAIEGGQWNSTSSSSGDQVARGWIDSKIGCKKSANLVD